MVQVVVRACTYFGATLSAVCQRIIKSACTVLHAVTFVKLLILRGFSYTPKNIFYYGFVR